MSQSFDMYDVSDMAFEMLGLDNLEPRTPPCENCGHVHLSGDDWVYVADGVCAPADTAPTLPRIKVQEEDDDEFFHDRDLCPTCQEHIMECDCP